MTDLEFYKKVLSLQFRRESFILATVIAVRGSSSAKPGSKALIDSRGRNLAGWVGGGCAESFVIEEGLKALEERRPRIVTVDLDDELLGVGMPCGGYMDLFLDPLFPKKRLFILGHGSVARKLTALSALAGYSVHVEAPVEEKDHFPHAEETGPQLLGEGEATSDDFVVATDEGKKRGFDPHVLFIDGTTKTTEEAPYRALDLLIRIIILDRKGTGRSLREVKGIPLYGKPKKFVHNQLKELCIVGHNRITEELAKIAANLCWKVSVNSRKVERENYPRSVRFITKDTDLRVEEVKPGAHVVIATQHKGDHLSLKRVLKKRAHYIGLIASEKRTKLILDYLFAEGFKGEELVNLHAPSGLDLKAETPFDIALSIFSEVVATCFSKNR